MNYDRVYISSADVPRSVAPAFQHVVDIYTGETNKTASVWSRFTGAELTWRPDPRSSTVADILKHQLLSERRFFGEFLESPEPRAGEVLPARQTVEAFTSRFIELAARRLSWLSARTEADWLQTTRFFDVQRERIWVFWRRVLHSAHHRTQLTVYLRLLNKPVPATYGPTADVTWLGADPTTSVDAAERR